MADNEDVPGVVEVGVRELQQRLSQLLTRVEAGEIVRVTSRGRAKALLVPAAAESSVAERLAELRQQARIEQGIREGWIRPALTDEPMPMPRRRFKPRRPSEEILREDRDYR